MKDTADPIAEMTRLAGVLRRRLLFSLFCCRFALTAAVTAFAAGAVILALRLLRPEWGGAFFAPVIAAGLLAAAAAALFFARRRTPAARRLLIYLDSLEPASNGMVSTALEVDPGEWRAGIRVPALPKLGPAAKRGVLPLAVGLLFLAGSMLFPVTALAEHQRRRLDISGETAALERKIELVEEENLAPEKEIELLRAELHELQEKNDAFETGRTYEILEALSRRVSSIGREAANRAMQMMEQAELLSLALEKLGEQAKDPKFGEARQQLADMLKSMASENPEFDRMLRDLFGDELKDLAVRLTPEMMEKLSQQMKLTAEQMQQLLEKLLDAELTPFQCGKPGECGGENGACDFSCLRAMTEEELARFLEENAAGAEALMLLLCKGGGGRPGAGGIGRGRGDAELDFTGGTADFTGERKELRLEGQLHPAGSTVIRRFDAAPVVEEGDRRAAAAGSLQTGEAQLERRTVRIHPEHRRAVKGYFSQE